MKMDKINLPRIITGPEDPEHFIRRMAGRKFTLYDFARNCGFTKAKYFEDDKPGMAEAWHEIKKFQEVGMVRKIDGNTRTLPSTWHSLVRK